MFESRRSWVKAAFILALLAGVAARIAACCITPLWFDEIVSLKLATGAHSFSDLMSIHHDNHHILNGLWLWLLGTRASWLMYRLPSLIFGVASIGLAWVNGERLNRQGGMLAALFFALSYPMVVYSSEARGYAPMIFFSLLSFWLYRAEKPLPLSRLAALWLSIALGFLSHLTFIIFYLSLLAFSIGEILQNRKQIRKKCEDILRIHCVPIIFLICLYYSHIRFIPPVSLPNHALWLTLLSTFSLSLGGPPITLYFPPTLILMCIFAMLAAASLLLGIFWIRKKVGLEAIFYLTVIVIAPLAIICAIQPPAIAERYFLVSTAFFI